MTKLDESSSVFVRWATPRIELYDKQFNIPHLLAVAIADILIYVDNKQSVKVGRHTAKLLRNVKNTTRLSIRQWIDVITSHCASLPIPAGRNLLVAMNDINELVAE
jgi:hypothetical protein